MPTARQDGRDKNGLILPHHKQPGRPSVKSTGMSKRHSKEWMDATRQKIQGTQLVHHIMKTINILDEQYETLTAPQTGALTKSMNAKFKLLDKILPDLKSNQIDLSIDAKDNNELDAMSIEQVTDLMDGIRKGGKDREKSTNAIEGDFEEVNTDDEP